MENQALFNIVNNIEKHSKVKNVKDTITDIGSSDKKGVYDKMNNIVAHMLCNLTSSMRFEGSVNVDLNEISVNMVP